MPRPEVDELSPFAQRYEAAYSSTPQKFSLHPNGTWIIGQNPEGYGYGRGIDMHEFLHDRKSIHIPAIEGLAAEQFVQMALAQPLKEAGFQASLTPHNLEHGIRQKGVDILITDDPRQNDIQGRTNPLIYMGIDVKLRRGVKHHPDKFGWEDRIKSPWMYLSLENFKGNTDNRGNINIRQWMNDYSIPSINQGQQIPLVDQLRGYVVKRIERSISSYKEILRERVVFQERNDGGDEPLTLDAEGIPVAGPDLSLLKHKIAMMQELFTSIATNT